MFVVQETRRREDRLRPLGEVVRKDTLAFRSLSENGSNGSSEKENS